MEHADKGSLLAHHPQPEAERAAAYEAGAAWARPGPAALAWHAQIERSPHIASQRAWVAAVHDSPHSVAQQKRTPWGGSAWAS